MRRGTRTLLGGLLWAAAGLPTFVLALAWFWTDDLSGDSAWRAWQFRVLVAQLHIGIGVAIVAILAAILRRWRLTGTAGAAALIMVVAFFAPHFRSAPPAGDGPTLRVATANVYYRNSTPAAAAESLAALDPDLLLLQEWTPKDVAPFDERLAESHPYRLSHPADHPTGFAVYSKYPFSVEPTDDADLNQQALRLRLRFDDRDVIIYCVHPTSPGDDIGIHINRNQSRRLAEAARRETDPTLIAGDFNHTPNTWNDAVIRNADFTSSLDVAGGLFDFTWPFNRRAAILWPKFRIDDVLFSAGLTATSAATVNAPGSDHHAVVVEVGFVDASP